MEFTSLNQVQERRRTAFFFLEAVRARTIKQQQQKAIIGKKQQRKIKIKPETPPFSPIRLSHDDV